VSVSCTCVPPSPSTEYGTRQPANAVPQLQCRAVCVYRRAAVQASIVGCYSPHSRLLAVDRRMKDPRYTSACLSKLYIHVICVVAVLGLSCRIGLSAAATVHTHGCCRRMKDGRHKRSMHIQIIHETIYLIPYIYTTTTTTW
jgi:hypothetical protein